MSKFIQAIADLKTIAAEIEKIRGVKNAVVRLSSDGWGCACCDYFGKYRQTVNRYGPESACNDLCAELRAEPEKRISELRAELEALENGAATSTDHDA